MIPLIITLLQWEFVVTTMVIFCQCSFFFLNREPGENISLKISGISLNLSYIAHFSEEVILFSELKNSALIKISENLSKKLWILSENLGIFLKISHFLIRSRKMYNVSLTFLTNLTSIFLHDFLKHWNKLIKLINIRKLTWKIRDFLLYSLNLRYMKKSAIFSKVLMFSEWKIDSTWILNGFFSTNIALIELSDTEISRFRSDI